MLRIPVESSDIVSIGYDEPSRMLEVEFQNDRVYQYKDVEPNVYAQFMQADSYGQFFSTYVTRRYRFTKVKKEDEKVDLSGPLAFVTGNSDKFAELESAAAQYGFVIEQLPLPVEEIQSHNMEEIAVKKAKEAFKLAGRPVVIQDSFWNILALRGFPGAYMADVNKWFRAEDFIRLMEGKEDRDIVLTETIIYYDGKRPKIFSKEYRGAIAEKPRGKGRLPSNEVIMFGGRTIAEIKEKESGDPVIDPKDAVAYDFAKWFNMHRRVAR